MGEELVVDMDCICGYKCCEGKLYIQPDTLDNKTKCFVVSVTSGADGADVWLSREQVLQLVKELTAMLEVQDG
jgi:hypothetical protein